MHQSNNLCEFAGFVDYWEKKNCSVVPRRGANVVCCFVFRMTSPDVFNGVCALSLSWPLADPQHDRET